MRSLEDLSRREDRLMRKLVGRGSKHGTSAPSRAADVLRGPIPWVGFVAALVLSGPRGRRAALRGTACSAVACMVHLPLKRLFGRRRPRGPSPLAGNALTSSFPSGHTASDLSFTFGAAQEIPPLLAPLSVATLGSHWSLIRARRHYPSDIVAGGAIALAVTLAAYKLRPPGSRSAMPNRLLGIYLNDQLAAGVLWRETARRAQRSNAGTALGDALERVASAIAEDVATFEQIMERLDVRKNPLKVALAMAGERAGRLKLNGRLKSYSSLSQFVELDFLVMGLEGKKILWQNLRDCAGLGERLPDIDFDELIVRAGRQREELEPFRRAAGEVALGEGAVAPDPTRAGVRTPA